MVIALIVLGTLCLVLFMALIGLAFKYFDVKGQCETATVMLREAAILSDRARSLIYKKFDYYLPYSLDRIKTEEIRLELEESE